VPVKKFETFEDAKKALWHFHPDKGYLEELASLWRFADKLSSIKYPKGVFKFKTIEEANKHRRDFELKQASQTGSNRKS